MRSVNKLWFADGRIFVEAADGSTHSQSLRFYPRLNRADDVQRGAWTQSHFGLHWELLDEDISFDSFMWSDDDPKTLFSGLTIAPY